MTARVARVIVSDDAMLGRGQPGDPYRRALRIYTLDGTLLVELDSGADKLDRGDEREIVNRVHSSMLAGFVHAEGSDEEPMLS